MYEFNGIVIYWKGDGDYYLSPTIGGWVKAKPLMLIFLKAVDSALVAHVTKADIKLIPGTQN